MRNREVKVMDKPLAATEMDELRAALEERIVALEAQLAMQQARTALISRLRDLNACEEVPAWVEQTNGSPEDLWAACQRGDWMIWLLEAVDYDDRTMRHITCDCASGVLPIYERAHPNDLRPRNCIAMARRYADGEATYDELITTRTAAWAAARDAARGAVWDAVNAAADATAKGAAWAAARAALWAASSDATRAAASDATRAALWAVSAVPSDEAWSAVMSRLADIVRARVSWADVERAMERAACKGVRDGRRGSLIKQRN